MIQDGAGTVALTKLGQGVFTLAGNHTYSGNTTISAGTLKIGSGTAAVGGAGKGDFIISGALDLNGYSVAVNGLAGSGMVTSGQSSSVTLTVGGDDATTTFSGAISNGTGTVSLTKIGSGAITLAGINNYTGDTTLTAGVLGFDRGGLGGGEVVFDGGALRWAGGNTEDVSGRFAAIGSGETAILDTNGNNITLAEVISGNGSLAKVGAGSLTLIGANTYAGATTIVAGSIIADDIVVASGSSNLGNATSAIVLGDGTHQGALVYTGESATFSRGFTVSAGGGRIESGIASETLTIAAGNIAVNGSLTFDGVGDVSVSGVISGAGALTKLGDGTLTLSGANTYTGTTSIVQGTLVANSIVVSGGASNLGNAASAIILGDATHRGTLSYSGAIATFTRGFSINSGGGEIDVVNPSETLTIATGGVSAAGDLTLGGAGDASVTSTISGAGSLTKVGAGTVFISGANSYDGETTVSEGTLQLGSAAAAPNGAGKGNWLVDATLDLNGYSATVNGLAGGGTVTSSQAGAVTFTVGGDDQSSLFEGTIEDGTGTVGVVKTGSGVVTFTGASAYSGDTTIGEGALGFDAASLGSGDILFDGGTLQWAVGNDEDVSGRIASIASGETAFLDTNGNDVTLAGAISGVGSLSKIGAGTMILSAVNTYAGGTNIEGGHLQFNSGATPSSGQIDIGSDGALNATGQYSTASTWLGSGKIATGSTGTLALTANESSTISMGSYASLYLGATTSATISGALTPAGGAYRLGGGAGTLTVSSMLADSGGATALSVRGDVILSGANTFSGGTVLDDGTLSIGSSSAIGGGSSDIDFEGGVLQVTGTTLMNLNGHTVNWSTFDGGFDIASAGNTFTISQNISGSGSVVKRGEGTLVLSGMNSYDGDTTINAGTLTVGSASALPSGAGKGDVIVDGTLDLNGYSATVNGLTGNGTVTSSDVGAVSLTVGAANQTSTFAGAIDDGDGTVALTKIGSGAFSLAGNSTYTGDTDVQAGVLSLDGNLNSHVTDHGGAVTGWFFRDPDLAAAVRKALGEAPDAILTPNDLASLYSLTLDSNVISDLKGLEHATNLYTLTVVPGDFSVNGSLADAEFSASLEWLSALENLEVLVLQGTGLTDEVLQTLGALQSLRTLDVRYNELAVIPLSTVELPSISSLLVYGNLDLTNAPRVGLQHLAGSLINIDLAADYPEKATTIEELAAALYHLPIEIYEYLVNTVEYVPYAGAMKGALAVLQTGAGNAWDTASLLAALFVETGAVDDTQDSRTQGYQYASGRVYLPIGTAMGYFGAANHESVEEIVESAGLNPELVLDGGSELVGVVFDHAWLEAKLGGEEWVSLDPSWKFRHIRSEARDILDDVAWDTDLTTSEYFDEVRSELPTEFYEAQVREYLAANEPWLSIADLVSMGPIIVQTIDSLPDRLPYALWDEDHEWDPQSSDPRPAETFVAIPESMTHRLRVVLHASVGDGQYFDSGLLSIPDVSLSSLIIRPTHELEAWVRPELVINGESVVQSRTALAPNSSMKITIEYYKPGDASSPSRAATHGSTIFESLYLAGNYYSIMVDAGQTSHQLLKEQRRVVNEAAIDYMDGAPLDMDASIGGFLHLANLEYISQLDAAAEAIYGITASRRDVSSVGFGLATAAGAGEAFYRPDTGSPYNVQALPPTLAKQLHIPVLPERYVFDLKGLELNSVSITGDETNAVELAHLVAHTTSALEHAVWEGLTNANAMSTIKSLQIAGELNIPIVEIAPYSSQGTINGLLNLGVFGSSIVAGISNYSSQGHTVWVPKTYTDLDDWHGLGYFVEGADGAPLAYIISGGLNGGENTGGPNDPNAPKDGEEGDQGKSPDPIIFANGTLTHDESDFSFPGLGVPLSFARHYQSSQTGDLTYDSDRGMGEGWSFTYSDRLETSAQPGDPVGTKIWFTEGGVRRQFVPDGVGGYVTPDSIFGTLIDNGAGLGFTWTDTHGNVVHFDDADGNGISRLESAADRYGNGVEVSYDGAHIDKVTDLVTPSRWIEFTYTGDKITAIEDFTGRTWTYAYGDEKLTSVTAPSDGDTPEAVVEYEYYTNASLDGLLKKVINPNGRATEFSYYPNRWGFEVKFAEGDVQTISYNVHRGQTAYIDERNIATYYAYNEEGNTVEELYADRTTKAFVWEDNLKRASTDAFGQTEFYDYDADGNLTTLTDRLGYVTTYAYTDYANLSSVTRHNGAGGGDDQVTEYRYFTDGNGKDDKLQEVEDAEGNVTSYTYAGADGARGLPDSMTRALGTVTTGDLDDYVTTYAYNDAGQILTIETRSAVATPVNESFTYDDRGSMLSSTNANGGQTTNTYDLVGRRLTSTLPDPDGVGGNPAPSTSYVYDLNGNLLSSTLTASTPDRVTGHVYDPMNRLVRIENPDGTYRTRQYDLVSNLIAETDELGRVTRYLYDERNRAIAIIAPDGNVLSTSYDGGGRVVTISDPLGNTTIFIHDALGRLTNTIDAKGGETTRYYDDSGNLYSVTDELGHTTIFYYDLLGRLTTVTEPDPDDGGPQSSPVTSFYYDANGNLSAETDALGRTTVYVYDEVDRLVMLIEPDPDDAGPQFSPVTEFAYDGVGNLLTVIDPLGNVTTNAYDALNRLISMTEPDPDYGGPQSSPVTTYLYDADGNLASVVDALGRETEYAYDNRNRLVRIAQPAPYGELYSESPVIEYGYDAVGNRTSIMDPFGVVTRYAYDDLDRLSSMTTVDGAVSRSEYDAAGNLIRSIDSLNRTTVYAYDELNRLVSLTDPREEVTAYGYDAVGNRTSVTAPNENLTEFVYDGLNRLIERIDPLDESTLYEYDAVDNLTQTTDREGRVRTYAYDDLDRLTTETWLDGISTVNTLEFTYDAVGNVLAAEDDFSAYEFIYDNLYRRIQSDNAGTPGAPNVILDYAYDAVGNRVSVSDDVGVTVDSVYDNLNRLNRRTWDGGGIDEARIDFGYNARSEQTAAYRYSDLAGTQQIGRSSYGHDALGRLNSIDHFDALDAAIAEYDYAHDLAGQLVEWSHHGETIDFTHDDAGQLTSADYGTQADENYVYDANGNRTGGGMVIGDNNQVLSDGTYDYEYDAEGNLILKTEIASGDYVEYAYDHRNRMVSAMNYSAGSVVLQVVEFTYDLFDRRIAKTVDDDGAGPNDSATVYTVYDGHHAWADFDESQDVLARYLFGDRVDEIVARWTPGDGTAWHLTDHLGTVRDLVDDAGDLLNTITYDSFGNIVTETNAAAGDRFTYTGREYDSELELYYYRARYYDSQLGRFVSQDPIGFEAGDANLYRYVENQPLIYVDASGLAKGSPGGLVGLVNAIQSGIDSLGGFGDFLNGIGDGGVKTGEAILGAITHPIDTAIGVGDAIWNYDRTAAAMWNDFTEKASSPHGWGEIFTDTILGPGG